MSIDHDAEEPLYLQLAAILRGQVAAGKITARVPLVKTLTEECGVAQGTAERALAVLHEEGLIRSSMGRGHFVVRRKSAGCPVPANAANASQRPGCLVRGTFRGSAQVTKLLASVPLQRSAGAK